jgi:hypothetical protein
MKRTFLFIALIFLVASGFSQEARTGSYWRVSTLSTPIGKALLDSTQVYVKSTHTWYQLTRNVPDSMTMQKALDSAYCTLGESGTIGGHPASYYLNTSTQFPQFGVGIDSTLIRTGIKFPAGYSIGIVVDAVVYINTATGAGSASVVPEIRYGTSIADTGTAVIVFPSAITSTTACTKKTVFDHGTIPAGNMVWLEFKTITTIPRNFSAIIIGHKQ